MTTTTKKSCFVIRPIGEEGSATRELSEKTYWELIVPAGESCGYEVSHAGLDHRQMITQAIVDSVLECDILIADLTGRNANVFYELSLRHAVRKRNICVVSAGELLPFDIKDFRTVFYRPDSIPESQKQLQEAIDACEVQHEGDIQSPISVAIDILQLGRGNTLERTVSRILANSEALMEMIGGLDQGIEFKIDEKLRHVARRFEAISEELVMYLQKMPPESLTADWILPRVRKMEQYVRNLQQTLPTELKGITLGYLRELVREKNSQ